MKVLLKSLIIGEGEDCPLSAEAVALLKNYLLDGHLELSNNRAERSSKSFLIDWKNFLFANTPKDAKFNAVIFSIIETAKENGLEPY